MSGVDRRVSPVVPTGVVEVESVAELRAHLAAHADLGGCVVKGLDLRGRPWADELVDVELAGSAFLGCHLDRVTLEQAQAAGALVFPPIGGLPFDPYRSDLYRPDELYEVFAGERAPGAPPPRYAACLDARIDAWFRTHRPPDVLAALAQRLHDHAISDALAERVAGRRVVAVMGGHDAQRGDERYARAVDLGRSLTRAGLTVATGGGPGAMEAVNLGALLAPASDERRDDALATLAGAPAWEDRDAWVGAGWVVRRALAGAGTAQGTSIGVPTWFYGHEPPNPFATWSAKYFENSVREDGLLALGTAGVVFTPGSAGTVQEIFQDATANHYAEPGAARPMVFLGRTHWEEELPVLPLLRSLAGDRPYAAQILVTDSVADAVAFVADRPETTRSER